MRYGRLLEGRLLDRYKRFFADVKLRNGRRVVAHCPNPGSMRNCRPDGATVWLTRNDDPRRKLRYTWELVQVERTLISVNTVRANQVVAEALADGAIEELCGYDRVRPEVRYGAGSRIDFLLSGGGAACYVEVKAVTLGLGGGLSVFPDSVSERASRHVRELMARVREGERAVLLFCCARADTRRVRPADDIDPVYGETLRRGVEAGVEVLAYRCDVSTGGMWLRERVPVEL